MSHQAIEFPEEIIRAKKLANIADSAIRIPIINIKFGLDFLVGLIPVAGDIIMFLVAYRIIRLGRKIGIPKPLRNKMIRNSVIDFLLGFVPAIGDFIDLFYKANNANVKLMEDWWLEQSRAKSHHSN
ncbi:DUF4112 domain-containing protein [Aliikangiella marina]|uniref:DUF4112 domain-containing protein n=1 Tax=Aliikangiella marina TaxID=1712262 RepID=A0A545TIV0_9GAMM|nr:DUF4112 domain-containing protein [Aliikangiella marina]TQV77106.1 DUF4112 domain-containing protein [Aliikangiella marina]